jgi:hypothetical protein
VNMAALNTIFLPTILSRNFRKFRIIFRANRAPPMRHKLRVAMLAVVRVASAFLFVDDVWGGGNCNLHDANFDLGCQIYANPHLFDASETKLASWMQILIRDLFKITSFISIYSSLISIPSSQSQSSGKSLVVSLD